MDCTSGNASREQVVREAGNRALRVLSSRYARMLRIIELLGDTGGMSEEALREVLREEGLPWRGVGQSLRELRELGFVEPQRGVGYRLTRLGGYVWHVLDVVKAYMGEVVDAARRGELDEDDVIFSLLHVDVHILLSSMIPLEEQERYHYPGLQAYVSLLVSNVLSCIYNAPGSPYQNVFEKVLEIFLKEETSNGAEGKRDGGEH